MAETFIDLDALLGETSRFTRTVGGREVTIEDVDFKDLPALNRRFSDFTFAGVVAGAKSVLSGAVVTPAFDDEWLESLPFSEATQLVLWQLNPTADDTREPEAPFYVRLRGHDLEIPSFTVADARYFAEHAGGLEAISERLAHVLDRVTLKDGSPLPEGFADGLKRAHVEAILSAFVNRAYQREEKNAPRPPTGGRSRRGTGTKSSGSSPTSTDTA